MKTKKVTAIVEASSTGFGIYVEDRLLPLTSYGDSIDEAKEDLKAVLAAMIGYYNKKKKRYQQRITMEISSLNTSMTLQVYSSTLGCLMLQVL